MTLEDFSAGLRAMAPALSNHLWQSTLFGFAAWLLTLALGKNRAASRYWVWLVASAKFLLPFSLLSSLGGHLAWSLRANTTGDVYFVIEEIVRPAASSGLPHLLPELLVAIWLSGLIVVLAVWCAPLAAGFPGDDKGNAITPRARSRYSTAAGTPRRDGGADRHPFVGNVSGAGNLWYFPSRIAVASRDVQESRRGRA